MRRSSRDEFRGAGSAETLEIGQRLAHAPFKRNRGPLTLPSPPRQVGERGAKGWRGAAEPYPKLGEGADAALS